MGVPPGQVTIRLCKGWVDVLFVRMVRNACRLYMTGSQAEITEAQQFRWWASLDRSTLVFVVEKDAYACGYGLVREIEGKLWVSGGLLQASRGAGTGRALFGFLKNLGFDKPVFLDVLESNQRALHLYESLGWYEIERRETPFGLAIVMRVDPELSGR